MPPFRPTPNKSAREAPNNQIGAGSGTVSTFDNSHVVQIKSGLDEATPVVSTDVVSPEALSRTTTGPLTTPLLMESTPTGVTMKHTPEIQLSAKREESAIVLR